jgi:hypothetical protein
MIPEPCGVFFSDPAEKISCFSSHPCRQSSFEDESGATRGAGVAVEEVVGDVVARGDGRRGAHWVLGDHVVVQRYKLKYDSIRIPQLFVHTMEHTASQP